MLPVALALPGALAIGLSLGLLGSGGSILTVPVLVYLLGQDEKVAIASSLAIVGIIALVGSLPHLQQKRIAWRAVFFFGVPGMLGTYIGAWSSAFVSGALQLAVFALVMMVAAYFMLKPETRSAHQSRPARPANRSTLMAEGLLVGVLTGFVGVGGGFLIVPALMLLGGLSIHQAVATSLVIIAMKSFAGFIKYTDVLAAQNLTLDIKVIATISLIGVLGSFGGHAIGNHLQQTTLKRAFGYFLGVMGVCILFQSSPAASTTELPMPLSRQVLKVSDRVTLAGQLNPQIIDALKQNKTRVIDLRTIDEDIALDQKKMHEAQIDYIHLPVGDLAIPQATSTTLTTLLTETPDAPVVIHCNSGNRAGLLWAIHLIEQGTTTEQALAVVAPITTKAPVVDAIKRYGSDQK